MSSSTSFFTSHMKPSWLPNFSRDTSRSIFLRWLTNRCLPTEYHGHEQPGARQRGGRAANTRSRLLLLARWLSGHPPTGRAAPTPRLSTASSASSARHRGAAATHAGGSPVSWPAVPSTEYTLKGRAQYWWRMPSHSVVTRPAHSLSVPRVLPGRWADERGT